MPNLVTNILTIFGPDVDKVKENIAYIGENGSIPDSIDFDRIIPVPKEIRPEPNSFIMSDELYHWRLDNWGTKWNASNYDSNTIHFTTAWDPPIPVMNKLSSMYPNNRFVLEVGGEHPAETLIFENGKIIFNQCFDYNSITDIYYNLLLDNGLSPYTCGYRYDKEKNECGYYDLVYFNDKYDDEKEFW